MHIATYSIQEEEEKLVKILKISESISARHFTGFDV